MIRLSDAAAGVADGAAAALARQVYAPGDADHGGCVRADWGIAEPTSTYGLVALCGLLYAARRLGVEGSDRGPADADLLTRAAAACDYLRRSQDDRGLISLLDCNYSSSPDAGFAVLALCPVLEIGRLVSDGSPEFRELLGAVESFVRSSTYGMAGGGFHTPNHRWVMSAAMAWASKLVSGIDVGGTVAEYLAEGYDVDAEGFFIERSAGVYDAICDRSLAILHEVTGDAAALDACRANLGLNLHLLHSDGTAETGLSRRQDYGTRSVPAGMIVPYLQAGTTLGDERFIAAADFLWSRSKGDPAGVLWFLLRGRLSAAAEPSGAARFPFDCSRHYPVNGLWRVRRGRTSASVYARATRLMSVVHGEAELSAVKISQSYFGVGRFVGDDMTVRDGRCVLCSYGRQAVNRPGYDYPLGRPASRERWYEERAERKVRTLPACESTLAIEELGDGFRLRYRTEAGAADVTAQIALDFPPGGVWETEDTALRPRAGEVLFLRRGHGAMRFGHDLIEVGPGADAHRMWAMRDTEAAPDHVRVLLTFRTPVDHAFTIRVLRAP